MQRSCPACWHSTAQDIKVSRISFSSHVPFNFILNSHITVPLLRERGGRREEERKKKKKEEEAEEEKKKKKKKPK